MIKVALVFPDITSLSEFILTCRVSKSVVETAHKRVVCLISEETLEMAIRKFGAVVKERKFQK